MNKIILTIAAILTFSTLSQAREQRKPSSDEAVVTQVQLCEGTEAFGNEGQGVAVAAFINYSSDRNYQTNAIERKCELGMAFSFEYGNDRGLKLGRFQPYNMNPVPAPKTACVVTEQNNEIYITVTKAAGVSVKAKKAPVVLIDRCKLSATGY